MLQLRICIVVDVLVAGGERGEVGREVDQVRVLLLSAPVGGSLAGQVIVIPLSTNTIIQIHKSQTQTIKYKISDLHTQGHQVWECWGAEVAFLQTFSC